MSDKAFQTPAELITMRESEVLTGKPRTVYRLLPWRLAISLTKKYARHNENHYQSS